MSALLRLQLRYCVREDEPYHVESLHEEAQDERCQYDNADVGCCTYTKSAMSHGNTDVRRTRDRQHDCINDHGCRQSEGVVPSIANLKVKDEDVLRESRQNSSNGLIIEVGQRCSATRACH